MRALLALCLLAASMASPAALRAQAARVVRAGAHAAPAPLGPAWRPGPPVVRDTGASLPRRGRARTIALGALTGGIVGGLVGFTLGQSACDACDEPTPVLAAGVLGISVGAGAGALIGLAVSRDTSAAR
ncbi:MAG TPA: hypothetical protein VEZ47_12530, partial [Gemmatirosa sp.]|nr:hypothetical protein [Gemmatirosa sp.]